MQNLLGQTFNQLTVIDFDSDIPGDHLWRCKCTCGNTCIVRASQLKANRTKSCGCLKQIKDKSPKIKLRKDLTGQVFGKLTVVQVGGTDSRGECLWDCKCSCGNQQIIKVLGSNLRTGHTTSCGCSRMSHGEEIISNILRVNQIKFTPFKSAFKFPDTNSTAFFDFYIDEKYYIEFDGETHYDLNNQFHGWYTEELVKEQQRRDLYKDNWCKDKHIPLIRIPYTHRNEITIEDLLLTPTNPFIVINIDNVFYTLDEIQDESLDTSPLDLHIKLKAPIYQFDLQGRFIKCFYDYESICNELNLAREKIPYTIIRCCNHNCKQSLGYQWSFIKESQNLYPHIQQLSLEDLVIAEYSQDNIPDIFDKELILKVCRGKRKTHKHFKWRFIQ